MTQEAKNTPNFTPDFQSNPASEQLIWSGSSSQSGNFGIYAACALVSLTVIGLIWTIPLAAWTYFSTRNRHYELTNQRLILRTGIFTKKQEQIELYRVRDTKFVQPLVLRIFGLGNIELVSSEVTVHNVTITAVPDAQKVMESVRGAAEAIRAVKRVRVNETDWS